MRSLRKFFFLSVLLLLVCSASCFSEVVLTDEEAEQLMTEIRKSKESAESVEMRSMRLEEQLKKYEMMQDELQTMQDEQSQFYKQQWIEARSDKRLTIAVSLLLILLIILLV